MYPLFFIEVLDRKLCWGDIMLFTINIPRNEIGTIIDTALRPPMTPLVIRGKKIIYVTAGIALLVFGSCIYLCFSLDYGFTGVT